MLNLTTLGSSSKGNCYLVRAGDEVLMLECGVRYKNILHALEFNLAPVAGCLLTHEHRDHSLAADDVMKAGIDVYSGKGTFSALGITGHRARQVQAKEQFNAGGFTVLPFAAEHNAKEPLGYVVYHPEMGKLLFVTDTGTLKYKFDGLNYVMIECNYSEDILRSNIEKGLLDPSVRRKVVENHLSLKQVKRFFALNDKTALKEVKLLHLSGGSSDAERFKAEIIRASGAQTDVC